MAHITVPNEPVFLDFIGVTGSGPFAFSFNYQQDADISVELNGNPLSQNDFSIANGPIITGGINGGSITLSGAITPAGQFNLRIIRAVMPGRVFDHAVNGLRPDDINSELDRIHMILMYYGFLIAAIESGTGTPGVDPGAITFLPV